MKKGGLEKGKDSVPSFHANERGERGGTLLISRRFRRRVAFFCWKKVYHFSPGKKNGKENKSAASVEHKRKGKTNTSVCRCRGKVLKSGARSPRCRKGKSSSIPRKWIRRAVIPSDAKKGDHLLLRKREEKKSTSAVG